MHSTAPVSPQPSHRHSPTDRYYTRSEGIMNPQVVSIAVLGDTAGQVFGMPAGMPASGATRIPVLEYHLLHGGQGHHAEGHNSRMTTSVTTDTGDTYVRSILALPKPFKTDTVTVPLSDKGQLRARMKWVCFTTTTNDSASTSAVLSGLDGIIFLTTHSRDPKSLMQRASTWTEPLSRMEEWRKVKHPYRLFPAMQTTVYGFFPDSQEEFDAQERLRVALEHVGVGFQAAGGGHMTEDFSLIASRMLAKMHGISPITGPSPLRTLNSLNELQEYPAVPRGGTQVALSTLPTAPTPAATGKTNARGRTPGSLPPALTPSGDTPAPESVGTPSLPPSQFQLQYSQILSERIEEDALSPSRPAAVGKSFDGQLDPPFESSTAPAAFRSGNRRVAAPDDHTTARATDQAGIGKAKRDKVDSPAPRHFPRISPPAPATTDTPPVPPPKSKLRKDVDNPISPYRHPRPAPLPPGRLKPLPDINRDPLIGTGDLSPAPLQDEQDTQRTPGEDATSADSIIGEAEKKAGKRQTPTSGWWTGKTQAVQTEQKQKRRSFGIFGRSQGVEGMLHPESGQDNRAERSIAAGDPKVAPEHAARATGKARPSTASDRPHGVLKRPRSPDQMMENLSRTLDRMTQRVPPQWRNDARRPTSVVPPIESPESHDLQDPFQSTPNLPLEKVSVPDNRRWLLKSNLSDVLNFGQPAPAGPDQLPPLRDASDGPGSDQQARRRDAGGNEEHRLGLGLGLNIGSGVVNLNKPVRRGSEPDTRATDESLGAQASEAMNIQPTGKLHPSLNRVQSGERTEEGPSPELDTYSPSDAPPFGWNDLQDFVRGGQGASSDGSVTGSMIDKANSTDPSLVEAGSIRGSFGELRGRPGGLRTPRDLPPTTHSEQPEDERHVVAGDRDSDYAPSAGSQLEDAPETAADSHVPPSHGATIPRLYTPEPLASRRQTIPLPHADSGIPPQERQDAIVQGDETPYRRSLRVLAPGYEDSIPSTVRTDVGPFAEGSICNAAGSTFSPERQPKRSEVAPFEVYDSATALPGTPFAYPPGRLATNVGNQSSVPEHFQPIKRPNPFIRYLQDLPLLARFKRSSFRLIREQVPHFPANLTFAGTRGKAPPGGTMDSIWAQGVTRPEGAMLPVPGVMSPTAPTPAPPARPGAAVHQDEPVTREHQDAPLITTQPKRKEPPRTAPAAITSRATPAESSKHVYAASNVKSAMKVSEAGSRPRQYGADQEAFTVASGALGTPESSNMPKSGDAADNRTKPTRSEVYSELSEDEIAPLERPGDRMSRISSYSSAANRGSMVPPVNWDSDELDAIDLTGGDKGDEQDKGKGKGKMRAVTEADKARERREAEARKEREREEMMAQMGCWEQLKFMWWSQN